MDSIISVEGGKAVIQRAKVVWDQVNVDTLVREEKTFSNDEEAQAFIDLLNKMNSPYTNVRIGTTDDKMWPGSEVIEFRYQFTGHDVPNPRSNAKRTFTRTDMVFDQWGTLSLDLTDADYSPYYMYIAYGNGFQLRIRHIKVWQTSKPKNVLEWDAADKTNTLTVRGGGCEFKDGYVELSGSWPALALVADTRVIPAGTNDLSVEIEYFLPEWLAEIPDFTPPIQNILIEDLPADDAWIDGTAAATPEEAREIINRGRRAYIQQQLSAACNAAIVGGVDVGDSHYTLNEEDQINIGNLAIAAAQGETTLYHADGELCRTYTPEEFGELAAVATRHKIYHTTYYNHLKAWVNRAKTPEELATIKYGAALPDDLAAHMEEVMPS